MIKFLDCKLFVSREHCILHEPASRVKKKKKRRRLRVRGVICMSPESLGRFLNMPASLSVKKDSWLLLYGVRPMWLENRRPRDCIK